MEETQRSVLSVILNTPNRFDTIRRTIRHLRAQTIRPRIEVVIVTPSAASLDPDAGELLWWLSPRTIRFPSPAGLRRWSWPTGNRGRPLAPPSETPTLAHS